MKIVHEKDILDDNFPFELWSSDWVNCYPHWHDGVELVYQLSGKSRVGINETIYDLKEREILFIGKGDIHYFCTDNIVGEMIVLQFGLSIVHQLPEKFSTIKLKNRYINPMTNFVLHVNLEKEIKEILRAYSEKKEMHRVVITARINDLITHILSDGELDDNENSDKSKQLIQLEKLEKVFDFVAKNFDQKIMLDDAARELSYSPYHFARFFKKNTGMTFLDFLSRYRINKAKLYLQDRDLTITEVAQKSGFCSIKTFNRVFKNICGCTPTEIRKKYLMTPKRP